MKVLSRDFTRKEKILIALLLLVLVGLAYYQFLDQPVRESIANAQAEQASLQTELDGLNAKIAVLEVMQREIDDLQAAGFVSIMPSYNSRDTEFSLLNDVLANTTQYSISFSDVSRDGDQIRRNFSLQFTVHNYAEMESILEQLTGSGYRCLLGDIRCSIGTVRRDNLSEPEDVISISATATFFETMVGGTPDPGLPADKAAAS